MKKLITVVLALAMTGAMFGSAFAQVTQTNANGAHDNVQNVANGGAGGQGGQGGQGGNASATGVPLAGSGNRPRQ